MIMIMRPYTPNNGPLTARQLLFVRLCTKLLITKFLRLTDQSGEFLGHMISLIMIL